MPERVQFRVPGVPIPQPRPRVFGGVAVSAPKGHPVIAYKEAVNVAAWIAWNQRPPLTGPVAVELLFLMPRPSALRWKTKPMPRLPHTAKPDADNLAKAVLDALALLWVDDNQVFRLNASKWIAAGGEEPGTIVRVMEVG